MNVLAISFGRQLFDVSNAERARMQACAAGVDQYHMLIFTRRADHLRPVINDRKLWLHPTASRNKLLMLYDAYRLGRQIVEANNIDVITAQNPFEAGFVAWLLARRYGIPLNIQEHGDNFSAPYWRRESMGNRVRYHIGVWLLQRADSVRVVAQRIVATMQQLGIKKERLLYVPVRTDVLDDDLPALPSSHSSEQVCVVSMARFESQKNLPLLISAFARVVAEYPAAKLLLVGTGSLTKTLRAHVRRLGIEQSVEWREWTDDPGALLRQADVYALSSDYEGWGRVLIEAMAYAVPVVTTDVGCAGEVVKDSVHGYVVPVRDEAAFAKALAALVADQSLREQFGAQARQDVGTTHISLHEYASAWRSVLETTKQLATKAARRG